MRFLHLIVKNVARNKRRTVLTVLSLSLSLFLFVFFDTIFKSWTQSSEGVPESRRRLIVRSISMSSFLPESHRKVMADVPGVELVVPWHWYNGRLKGKPKDFFPSYAVEVETFRMAWGEYKLDDGLYDRWQKTRQGAIVGKKLLLKFGWKVGDRVTLTSSVYPGSEPGFDLIGTYSGGQDEEGFFFHRRYLQELLKGSALEGTVGLYYVVVKDPAFMGRVIDEIDGRLKGSSAPTKSETEKDFVLGFVAMLGDVKSMIMKVTAVVLGVVLLVVVNTMAMSVRERTREIATLKAIGFTPGLVVGLVVAEGVVTALVAGVVGCVGARVLFENVLGRPTVFKYFANFSPSWSTVITGLAISVAIGVVSAVIPAWLASRIQVAQGLRRLG